MSPLSGAKKPRWSHRMTAASLRLREGAPWPIVAVFGSQFVVLLLTAHVVARLDSRAGSPADVVTLAEGAATSLPDSAIWFSVTPVDNDIVITTNDRQVFRYAQSQELVSEMAAFRRYLEARVRTEIVSAGVSGRFAEQQSRVIIAADQRLKYRHIRPILYALSAAGVRRYGFETLAPLARSHSATPLGHAAAPHG